MSGLRIDVADLLAHPGARRDVRVLEPVADLVGSAARVDGPVEIAIHLERIPDGIVVRGTLQCRWVGQCSVCLRDLEAELFLHVDELFEHDPIEGETYPIEGHEIDVEQLVRDAVLLELPLVPHCVEPCESDVLEADEAPEALPDPRWAALFDLEIP